MQLLLSPFNFAFRYWLARFPSRKRAPGGFATMRKNLRVKLALVVLAMGCGGGARQGFASGRGAQLSGTVRDNKGNPIAGALVSLIKEGSDEIIKEVRSVADG